WAKAKDDGGKSEAKAEFKQAEDVLQKFIARLAKSEFTPTNPDAVKQRAQFALVANQTLANIYIHEAVGRSEDALKFLEKVIAEIPPEDEKLSKMWELQIKAHLSLKHVD